MSQQSHQTKVTSEDVEDLLAVLTMRFGEVPPPVKEAIFKIQDANQIDHLILAAANAADWNEFAKELNYPVFRLTGPGFDPLNYNPRGAKEGRET